MMVLLYVLMIGLLCMMCGFGIYKINDCVINMMLVICVECLIGIF